MTGVYYGSAKLQHENYTEIEIPDVLVAIKQILNGISLGGFNNYFVVFPFSLGYIYEGDVQTLHGKWKI